MSSNSEGGASNVIEDLGDYEGERNEAGERHGIGKAQLPNGDLYDGRYKYGKRDGPGVYYFMRNNARYEGSYKEGEKHGHGTIVYPDGSSYEVPGLASNHITYWVIWEKIKHGTWEHNKRQGYGTYIYVNGDKYEGEWMNDIKHGQGTYEYSKSQAKFKGMWNLGRPEGMGTVEYLNFSYHGCLHDGLPVGEGTFSFESGYELKGKYVIEEKEEIVEDERLVFTTSQWVCNGEITKVASDLKECNQ